MEFQFHKGTIKTSTDGVSTDGVSTFQFHKGTIKTQAPPVWDGWLLISIP